MTILYALLSALAISAVSLIGVFFLLSKEELHGRKMHLLLALAAGAMLHGFGWWWVNIGVIPLVLVIIASLSWLGLRGHRQPTGASA